MNTNSSPTRRATVPFTRRVTLLVVGLLLVAASAPPTHALRHLRLLRSSPAADSVLTATPAAISLWFSEPTNPAVSSISLQAVGGGMVPLGKLSRAAGTDAPLTATLPPALAPGAYSVSWKTMSKDGHVVNGTFGFSIRTAN